MRKLEEPEYTDIWEDFDRAFSFRPAYGGPYPGIIEPDPSIVFEIPEPRTDEEVDEFSRCIRESLKRCTRAGKEVYYLDWQHQCYAFQPWSEPLMVPNGFPDGDYAILLAPDLSFGSFGHPWEGTICFFGRELWVRVVEGSTWLNMVNLKAKSPTTDYLPPSSFKGMTTSHKMKRKEENRSRYQVIVDFGAGKVHENARRKGAYKVAASGLTSARGVDAPGNSQTSSS